MKAVRAVLLGASFAAYFALPAIAQTSAERATARATFDRISKIDPLKLDAFTGPDASAFSSTARTIERLQEATASWERELFHHVVRDRFWSEATSPSLQRQIGIDTPGEESVFDELLRAKRREVSAAAVVWLEAEIKRRGGWPRISEIGSEQTSYYEALALFAGHDVEFQKRVLALMKPLAAAGEVNRSNYLGLHNRVAAKEGRPPLQESDLP